MSDDATSGGDLFRLAFAAAAERRMRSDEALRSSTDDPEPVHQARVAVRRMRSHLRAFAPLLEPQWATGLSERLRWWGNALGAARDADVLLHGMRMRAATLPAGDRPELTALLATFADARSAAYARVAQDRCDPRYRPLLDEIRDAADHPRFTAPAAAPAADVVPELLAEAWRKLRRAVRRRSRPPTDTELHRIRIRAKRVRYIAEAVTPCAGHPAQHFARCVEHLQTVLGNQHDAAIAGQQLRQLGAHDGAAFAAGELAALARAEADEGRRTWRAAWRDARHHRFW
jgi:CHAD domain-containing protein